MVPVHFLNAVLGSGSCVFLRSGSRIFLDNIFVSGLCVFLAGILGGRSCMFFGSIPG